MLTLLKILLGNILLLLIVQITTSGCSLIPEGLPGSSKTSTTTSTETAVTCPASDVYCSKANLCCASDKPFYCNSLCYSNPSKCGGVYETCSGSSGTSQGTGGTGGGTSASGCCPAGSNIQCSQMVPSTGCGVQSCTCYYSGSNGDTHGAFYKTSTGKYFDCAQCGTSSPNCSSAANLAAAAIVSCQ